MSHNEQICEREREKLEWIIEQQARLLRSEFDLISKLLDRKGSAVKAVLKLDKMNNAKLATFQDFDANGVSVKPNGPITFASDNPSVATIDSAQQSLNADFSVTCPVVSVPGATGVANITGVDTLADGSKLAAGDVDNVTPVVVPIQKSAKLVLS